MRIIPEIEAFREELVILRRDIHAHPELAFEEERTSSLVSELLDSWGFTVSRGLAKTGVVGTLVRGKGRRVGLRADMDALPMQEENNFEHKSKEDGKMHACGHDGHTVMLLAAARYLSEHLDFSGTINVIFQPAEEAAGGAKVMIEEGLFEQFPMDAVFGMHNWPGIDAGKFAMRPGPMMASLDCFDISIEGRGAHGALPHEGVDPIVTAAQVITALQSIVSRNMDPLRSAVVSVTKVHAGSAHNIIPECVELGGGLRCFEPEIREVLRSRIKSIVERVCEGMGAKGSVIFGSGYPAVINYPEDIILAGKVASDIVGAENVDIDSEPSMGSEDFAYMLEKKPGCYVFIGNGVGEGSCMVHNPNYDFNDEILVLGATYWVRLAQMYLGDQSS